MAKERAILIYSPKYNLDLGAHVFPAIKYAKLYEEICRDPELSKLKLISPEPARMEDIELVHTFNYLEDLFSYHHTFRTVRSELPLNRSIVESVMMGVGGTVKAMELSDQYQFCLNLGGGYHHAMPDHAEGFCYLNDVAIATKLYLLLNPNRKVLILDLDLHQGNGNAYIFQDEPNVFTFSMHQDNIYPKKEKSSMDIPLQPGIQDKEYLNILNSSLETIKEKFQPNLIFYLAGADPYEKDTLGELKVSMEGLMKRDRMIRDFALNLNVPLVLTLAGGYAEDWRDTVQIHFNTIKVLAVEEYN